MKLRRDNYFWTVVSLIVAGLLFSYWGDRYLPETGWFGGEYHLTWYLLRDTILVMAIVVATWRFGFRAGLVTWLAVGLILAPYIYTETVARGGKLDIIGRYIVAAAIGLFLLWLVNYTRRSREALRVSQETLSALLNNAPIITMIVDPEWQVRQINHAGAEFAGRPVGEMLNLRGGEALRCVHRLDDLGGCGFGPFCQTCTVRLTVLDSFATGKGHYRVEASLPFASRDGEATFLLTTVPLTLPAGPHLLVYIEDITERKQAEMELAEQKELTDHVLATAPSAILVIDKDQQVVLVNQAFYDIFNLESGQAEGKPLNEVLDIVGLPETVSRALESGLPQFNQEFRYLVADEPRILMGDLVPMKREEGGLLLVLRDVTSERAIQQQLYHAGRMASIGELTAGIAHELNNPLTGVIGYAQLLLRADVPEEVKKDLQAIYDSAQRVATIVRNLLAFARQREPHKELVDLNEVIKHLLDLRSYEMKANNIEVVTELASELPPVAADPQQLEQVFLNVIINAEQAMTEAHGRGSLKVTSKVVDSIIKVSLADDGPGIAPENLERVFNPFFTTKEVGKGTGLGLSIAYGLVVEHGGRIWAESQEGKGATFFVELPVAPLEENG